MNECDMARAKQAEVQRATQGGLVGGLAGQSFHPYRDTLDAPKIQEAGFGIGQEIQRQAKAIDELSHVISALAEILDPLLTPDAPQNDDARVSAAPRPPQAPMAAAISDATCCIEVAITRLSRLRSRVVL